MKHKCPSCGFENIQGEDRCDQCLHSLMHREIKPHDQLDKYQNAMMNLPISELITGSDLLVASPSDSMEKIVRTFQRESKNCILIYDHKKLVGIISNRDILRKVAGLGKKLSEISAEEVMTPKPEYVKDTDPVAYVVNKMALGGYRHVPVLAEDGTPITIITIRDVLQYLAERNSTV